MLVPLFVAMASVAAGTALAMWPRASRRALGVARTFAFCASISVVALHLLPEAMERLGGAALLGLIAGLVAPGIVEKASGVVGRAGTERFASHLAFFALLVHQVADGMGLFAFTGGQVERLDVAFALAAHTVPIVLLVLLDPVSRGAQREAWVRASLLAVATCGGVVFGGLVSAEQLAAAMPFIASVTSGFLLHVIFHGARVDPPETVRMRALDLSAAILAVALSVLGAWRHELAMEGDATWLELLGRSAAFAVARHAPLALLGLLGTVLLRRVATRYEARLVTLRFERVVGIAGAAFGAVVLGLAPLLVWVLCAVALIRIDPETARRTHDPARPAEQRAHEHEPLARTLADVSLGTGPSLLTGFAVAIYLDALSRVPWATSWIVVLAAAALLFVSVVPSGAPGVALALAVEPMIRIGLPVPYAVALLVAIPVVRVEIAERRALRPFVLAAAVASVLAAVALHFVRLGAPLRLLLDDRIAWTAAAIVLVTCAIGVWQRGVRSWFTA